MVSQPTSLSGITATKYLDKVFSEWWELQLEGTGSKMEPGALINHVHA